VALERNGQVNVLADHLQYGQASEYVLSRTYDPGSCPALRITDAATGNQITFIGPGFISFPGHSVYTPLISGKLKPTIGDTTISLSTMLESATDVNCLHGQSPSPIQFCALRLVNLIPTGTVDGPREPMNRIDLSFQASDLVTSDVYNTNGRYRRELTYSQKQVMEIFNLETYVAGWRINPHILLAAFSTALPSAYQIELHMPSAIPDGDQYRYQYQPRLVSGPQMLTVVGNVWYTIVAYGPLDTSGAVARTSVLNDDIPIISGAATLRFFHGAYDTGNSRLQGRRLALRVKGTATMTAPAAYGEALAGSRGSISVPAGIVRFEVVDESGNVALDQDVTLPDAGCGYNVFLHRGATGEALRLDVAKQQFTFL
jgi:hypothetical protein